jgi:hypothetical protein
MKNTLQTTTTTTSTGNIRTSTSVSINDIHKIKRQLQMIRDILDDLEKKIDDFSM